MPEHTKQQIENGITRRQAAVAALAEIILERSHLKRGVLSSIVCTCQHCRRQELFVITERAIKWADEHGDHAPLTFSLLAGGVSVTSAGTV